MFCLDLAWTWTRHGLETIYTAQPSPAQHSVLKLPSTEQLLIHEWRRADTRKVGKGLHCQQMFVVSPLPSLIFLVVWTK